MAAAVAHLVRLLDVEPELASRLREDDRAEARQRLIATTHVVPKGGDATAFEETFGRAFGLMVVDGVLLHEVLLAGRPSLQLLGPGDVVVPHAAPSALSASTRWIAAMPTTVAILDDRLQAPLALWPGLALGLVDRVAQQVERGSVHSAILQMPRVEDRLEAAFWDLTERWGRVTPDGIHLPLRLTHEVLARLVGGRRPTISLALTTLTELGVLARRADGSWLVTGDRPSLAVHPVEGPPVEALRRPAIARTATDASPPQVRWRPDARTELLAATRRVVEEHELSARRVLAGRSRFEETRARSRQLREQAAAQRADHRATRAGPGLPLRSSRPAAPSSG
jgi:CRP/FNR family transcriptional regulator, cyclic AMP receptor protein